MSPGHGVRNAHVSPHHLVNLILALAGGEPFDAPDTAARYRNLQLGRAGKKLDWVPLAATLGETLHNIIVLYATSEGEPWYPDKLVVVMNLDLWTSTARIELHQKEMTQPIRRHSKQGVVFEVGTDAPLPEPGTCPPGILAHSVTLDRDAFRLMAELSRDAITPSLIEGVTMMPGHPTLAPLSALPRVLAAHTGIPSPSYMRLWRAAVEARFPAQQVNGRWCFDAADLPRIAEAFSATRNSA